MKKLLKLLAVIIVIAALSALTLGLVACNGNKDDLRFSAPQGTPALAMLRLSADNPEIDGHKIEYSVVNPDNIALEMSTDKSDIVIMPVNGGANLIRKGKGYKLVSVAVEGSLFMVGKKTGSDTITIDDVKGKRIACIGKTGVPGLIFRYVMTKNNIEVIENGEPNENQVLVKYVPAAPNAMSELSNNSCDFAVVGEPAATQAKNNQALGVNAEMDMQLEYSRLDSANGTTFPQAGLFVTDKLAGDVKFMNSLFNALSASKDWVVAHPSEVQEFAKQNLYEAAVFPAASIARCAIKCEALDENAKNQIIAFLKNVMPKDDTQTAIDWDAAKSKIFG